MAKFQRKTKEERCKEIMAAAKKVFLKKGFRNTTMEDVIAKTTLSKGGVYQYYKSTKSIMFDIMQEGNYFRHNKTEQIIKNNIDDNDMCEVLTKVIISKIIDPVPEKKLYLMFLAEILYDKEYEKLHVKLEKQAFDLNSKAFDQYFKRHPEAIKTDKNLKNIDVKFLVRVLNGILISYELFEKKEIFNNDTENLHNLIYMLVKNTVLK